MKKSEVRISCDNDKRWDERKTAGWYDETKYVANMIIRCNATKADTLIVTWSRYTNHHVTEKRSLGAATSDEQKLPRKRTALGQVIILIVSSSP